MRALITGGAGFIGSHMVEALLRGGSQVRVFDNFSSGSPENLADVHDEVEILDADLRDFDALSDAATGVDLVVHFGALGSVPRSVADPRTTHDVNATGTLNTLLAARDNDVQRVVFASSSSVFGSNPDLPKHEEMLGLPLSPYAASKSIGEDYCRQFQELYGLDTVTVRLFNVFGPRQPSNHAYAAVVPKFVDAALASRPVEIHGDGQQRRDFTYVSNVIDGVLRLAEAGPDVAGETFHLACGASVSLLEVLDTLEEYLDVSIERHHVDPRPGDIRDSLASIDRLMSTTGYIPLVSVDEGLRRTVDWWRSQDGH